MHDHVSDRGRSHLMAEWRPMASDGDVDGSRDRDDATLPEARSGSLLSMKQEIKLLQVCVGGLLFMTNFSCCLSASRKFNATRNAERHHFFFTTAHQLH